MLPAVSDGKPTKSFWSRPEGNTGLVTLGLVAVGGFFLLEAILPTLNNFLSLAIGTIGKLYVLGALGTGLVAILYVLMNKKFQTLVKYMFKSSMRAITGTFIMIDPIGIMKGYIQTLREKQANFVAQKTKVKGQIRAVDEIVKTQTKAMDNCMYAMQAAEKSGNNKEKIFQSKEFGRLQESTERYTASLGKLRAIDTVLSKVAEACDYTIRDIESDVKMKEQDRKMMAATSSAINSAMSILKGSSSEKELFDQAMEYTVEEYATKLGAMDEFMDSTESILSNIDSTNGMWNEKAMAALAEWEHRSDSVLVGGEKRLLVESSSTSPMNFTSFGTSDDNKVSIKQNEEFNKFFNK